MADASKVVAAITAAIDPTLAKSAVQQKIRPGAPVSLKDLAGTKVEIGIDDSGLYMLATVQSDAGTEPPEYAHVSETDKIFAAVATVLASGHVLGADRRKFTAKG